MIDIKVDGMLPFKIRDDAELTIFENINARNIHIGRVVRKRAADLIEKHGGKCGDYLVFPILEGKYDDKVIHFERKLENWRGAKNQHGEYRDTIDLELNEDEAYVLGLYTAEGSVSDRKLYFSLHVKETYLRDRVIAFAEKYGYGYHVRYKRDKLLMEVVIYSALLSDLFSLLCGKGAHNKHIPQIILLHKDKKLLEAYLQGYLNGDGHYEKRYKRQTFATVSKLLALQIQLAGLRLGKYFAIYYKKNNGFGNGGIYRGVLSTNIHSIFSADGKYIYIPIRSVKRVEEAAG